jgi:superfamily I DNA/RNA helicase
MATIYPNTPVGALPPEIAKVFRLLKRLPDEQYDVWQRLSIWPEPGPDFWVRERSGRSLLLKVSLATVQDARGAYQATLFTENGDRFGVAEMAAIAHFRDALPGQLDAAHLPAAIVAPNVPQSELALATADPLTPAITWASRDDLVLERFAGWVEAQLGEPLAPAQTDTLRAAFAPEVVVPAALTVRVPPRHDTAARLTNYLLSYDQERLLKTDLDLSDEAQAASGELGLQLVSGVAGSGKSLLVMYRARLLRQFFPQKRILVLTHNRPLVRDLEARYRRLAGGDPMVEWRTFHSWCQAHWPAGERLPRPIGARRRAPIIAAAWREHLADTAISERMLEEELDWFKDRLLNTRQEYLAADRTGRGFGLTEAMRDRMFDAITAYRRSMVARQAVDWGDLPRRMWLALREGRSAIEPYDFVLVDEAQFFAPIWFEIIKLALKPNGHLFMVADPTQGFLRRGESWLASGLSVRGRAARLERCYRTTREILDFASRMYQLRLPDDEEALVAPAGEHMPGGQAPQVIALDSEQGELAQVVNEIRALCERGTPFEHILVLHADWQGVERVIERLRRTFGEASVANPKAAAPGKHIRVCTVNAATGLESPIVFLMGTHRLYESEQSVRLNADERAELIRDNTRKLYMAFTRAGQRLAITYVGELPELFQQLQNGAHHYPAAAGNSST